jgi:RNA polymerase sigma-70 factor (ECF subfamily)
MREPELHAPASRLDSDGSRQGEPADPSSFQRAFESLFEERFQRLYRYLDRLSSEPELANDLAQEAFIRLFRRGSLPDAPEAWLVTVAMNLLRNAKSTSTRRRRLLEEFPTDASPEGTRGVEAEPEERATRKNVRRVLDGLPERDRSLLLLRAEGYSYRDIALALDLNEASVGTLLARARAAFKSAYEDTTHAS